MAFEHSDTRVFMFVRQTFSVAALSMAGSDERCLVNGDNAIRYDTSRI